MIAPDPIMTFNPDSARWYYTYAIPGTATAVDFVFNNGAGTWDNNGGADWHVAVTGATAPPHVIDGALDSGVLPVASCGAVRLYADYDGRYLYLAAPAVSATTNLDHFILVAQPATTGTTAAPWSKAGTVAIWDGFLAGENDNSFIGWFNATQAQQTSAAYQKASGAVLEGMLDLETILGTAPASVNVAFAGYATADGGALTLQAPCGNGDGNLDALEWSTVSAHRVAVGDVPRALNRLSIRMRSTNPGHGAIRAAIELGEGTHATVDLVDVRGRRVERLFQGEARGAIEVMTSAARDQKRAAGVYFLSVQTGRGSVAKRVVILR